MAGLRVSDKPVLRGKLPLLPTSDRPFFFVGQPLEVQKTLRTHLLNAPSGQAQLFLNMMSHVACCSTLVHLEGQHLWQPPTDEPLCILRVGTSGSQQQMNILQETYLQYVEDIFNPALHGNAGLSVVYA